MGFVEILKTFNAGDIGIIKSILDGEGIEYYVRGENFNLVEPLVQPVTFFIREQDRQTVMDLLDGLNIQFIGLS
ncbi:MAG: hypothetical protein H6627_10330 [Calditrichae bacterium]|nr:hypothetical protein [Calditrichota bacterium]MCB9058953.1 hypothetical protein [Calditrichia bacterium]